VTTMGVIERVGVGASYGLEWAIQQWVCRTGIPVRACDAPWLVGPVGTDRIGADFYEDYADQSGLIVSKGDMNDVESAAGLLRDFDALESPSFAPEKIDPAVRDFYEHTARYALDVWSQWTGPLKPFAHVLVGLVSQRIEQLNLPMAPLDTSAGMSSDIISLVDKETGNATYAGWLRRTRETGSVVYAGFYTTCLPPGYAGACVKVVFPLPGGSATVVLRPENRRDGSFRLVSYGKRFGDPGYYRVHETDKGMLRVKYLPLKETIHVFRDNLGVLRTDHVFYFWGLKFLMLHYKITRT